MKNVNTMGKIITSMFTLFTYIFYNASFAFSYQQRVKRLEKTKKTTAV